MFEAAGVERRNRGTRAILNIDPPDHLNNAPIATMKPCGARMGDHHFLKDGILEDRGQMTSRGFDFG
jgi:hypothetical protein